MFRESKLHQKLRTYIFLWIIFADCCSSFFEFLSGSDWNSSYLHPLVQEGLMVSSLDSPDFILQTIMISLTILVICIVSVSSLHLRFSSAHLIQPSSSLSSTVKDITSKALFTNQIIDSNVSSLNPYNQLDRIGNLQRIIISSRSFFLQLQTFSQTSEPYCLNAPSNLLAVIQSSLNEVKTNSEQLSQISAVENPNSTINGFPNRIQDIAKTILKDFNQSGSSIVSDGKISNINNLISLNWVVSNSSQDISKEMDKLSVYTNICPSEAPFVDESNQCISCTDYYNISSKKCINCLKFDPLKHTCSNSNGAESQNISTGNITATQRISNANNLTGLMLPQGTSLLDYQKSLIQNPLGLNTLPCPLATPFFDGTQCITCPPSQYFSVVGKSCQTCPAERVYNPSKMICQMVSLYSNLEVRLWTSIGQPSSQIIKQIKENSTKANSKSCPIVTPYFDGKNCVACQEPNPLFSYDGLKCTSCVEPTVFDPNIYSCVSRQRMQTNPSNVQNLILGGRSFNQWKINYFNTQTADSQVSDCPPSKPYFDGVICIACTPETPYFSLEYRTCQQCGGETKYDRQVRECLSTSGNIVSQSPSILKMAASIFS